MFGRPVDYPLDLKGHRPPLAQTAFTNPAVCLRMMAPEKEKFRPKPVPKGFHQRLNIQQIIHFNIQPSRLCIRRLRANIDKKLSIKLFQTTTPSK
jgi:hypothetical protein